MNIAPPPFLPCLGLTLISHKVDRILNVSYVSLNTWLKVKNQNYTLKKFES